MLSEETEKNEKKYITDIMNEQVLLDYENSFDKAWSFENETFKIKNNAHEQQITVYQYDKLNYKVDDVVNELQSFESYEDKDYCDEYNKNTINILYGDFIKKNMTIEDYLHKYIDMITFIKVPDNFKQKNILSVHLIGPCDGNNTCILFETHFHFYFVKYHY
jgi:hypothetical protein